MTQNGLSTTINYQYSIDIGQIMQCYRLIIYPVSTSFQLRPINFMFLGPRKQIKSPKDVSPFRHYNDRIVLTSKYKGLTLK